MEDPKKVVDILLRQGRNFTFQNFSTKSQYGYPDAYVPDWTAWRARVSGAVKSLFGDSSAQYRMISTADRVQVLGNKEGQFKLQLSYYLGALEAAAATLDSDTFGELLQQKNAVATKDLTNKVFIVHGRDSDAKNELEVLLREMGLEPVVLHRQADGGRTIIEKFEEHADVGFAFILLTPDEIAYLATEEVKPDKDRAKEFRARPNVIFEFGYFVGRLGRDRTCCLHRGDVVLPSDLDGIIYKKFMTSIEDVAWGIQRELKAAGYTLP